MAKETNLLVIMADEYNPKVMGSYGHSIVKTPNLDALAQNGTRFQAAYTPNPICIPARAALATGLFTHQTEYWDNCIGYDGRISSWGHRLQETGHPVVSIGKLHFMNETDPTGFDEQIIPMHIVGGGDVHGLVRDDPPFRPQCKGLAETAGPGETDYVKYDRRVMEEACKWLQNAGNRSDDKNWTLFVSFACPHFPLVPPQEFYDLYSLDEIPLPKQRNEKDWPKNDWWRAFENCYVFDRFFRDDEHRKVAIAAYFGLCSFVDDNVGKVLNALREAGLAENTRILFTSDHGDNLGSRGLWGKSTMYEESAGIPMIMAGPDIPQGKVVSTPVSLIDVYPTVLDCLAEEPNAEDLKRPGTSLLEIIERPEDTARIVFSEYHATATTTGEYMIRRGRYKYIYYHGFEPELYDLETDPEEMNDLARDPKYKGLLREFETYLRNMLDPEEVDRRAKAAQAILIGHYGGVEKVRSYGGPVTTPTPI